VLLVRAIAKLALRDIVRSVEQARATLTFITALRPSGAVAGSVLTVDVDLLIYAYGLPLFAALTLAARERARWTILALGIVALLPFVVFGVVADFLKNIAITSGPLVASQAGFSAAQREMIAFAYQFGTLILPTVVPAVVWVVTHRAFLERMRGRM
jgi:hypothetical protein